MLHDVRTSNYHPKTKSGVGRGTIELNIFESSVLKDNPLGDPSARVIPVYLPPSYNTSKTRRYPVIYMLTGFTGTGLHHINFSFMYPSLPERLESLFSKKAMPELIVVMPDCMTRFGGSQYINSEGTGRYEDHLIKELIPFIDSRYLTLAKREHRAVMGKSSGGYGALVLGMRYPEIFSSIACHSGDMYFELCYGVEFPIACRILEKHGGSLKKFYANFESAPKKPPDVFPLVNCVAMAAAYSPTTKRTFPQNLDLPFDIHTCERNSEIWEKWLEHDPVSLIDKKKYQDALRQMKLLFIDCGKKDEFHLQFGSRIFSKRLTKLGLRHRYEEFDDTHMDIAYRYETSLPLIAKAIKV